MYSQIYLLILVLTYGLWLVSQPGQKHIKPGLAGHEKPKPDEATDAGPGLEYLRPSWDSKSLEVSLQCPHLSVHSNSASRFKVAHLGKLRWSPRISAECWSQYWQLWHVSWSEQSYLHSSYSSAHTNPAANAQCCCTDGWDIRWMLFCIYLLPLL